MTQVNLAEQLTSAEAEMNIGNYTLAEELASNVLVEIENIHSREQSESPGDDDIVFATLRSNALLRLAYITYRRGNYSISLAQAESAATIAEEFNLVSVMVKIWHLYGNVYQSLGKYDISLEYYGKSLVAHQELGEKSGVANAICGIGNVYRFLGKYDMALEYYGRAVAVYDELDNKSSIAQVMTNMGNVYLKIGIYDKSLEYYSIALSVHENLLEKSTAAIAVGNIGIVYKLLEMPDRALEYFNKALAAHKELGEKSNEARVTGNMGNVYFSIGDFDKSLEYTSKALALHEELGVRSGVARNMGNIGLAYYRTGIYDKALEFFGKALAVNEELGAKSSVARVTIHIGGLYGSPNFDGYDFDKANEYLMRALAESAEIGAKGLLVDAYKSLADLYENEKRWEEAHLGYKKYHELEKEVQSEESKKQAEQMEYRLKIEESERDRQVKLARFQEQEKILHNILPSQIAERMVSGEKTIADTHENVSVFFSDIVGFTKLSQQIPAVELVGMLNGIFTQFDQLARKYGLEKIKTIGDAYMAVCGAPIPMENHAERTALFALEVSELMNEYRTNSGERVELRIGLHSGSVVAGIIGENKFAYDMWGDAVNTAARMESYGEPNRIHVSEDFANAIVRAGCDLSLPHLQFIERGEMDIKGKGMMKTYFLEKV